MLKTVSSIDLAAAVTLGNTVLNPGSTVTVVGNLTLTNPTISGGTINVSTSNVTGTISATANGSNSMMIAPIGYLIVDINGTNQKIPYYNT